MCKMKNVITRNLSNFLGFKEYVGLVSTIVAIIIDTGCVFPSHIDL
jgi:hypothetical protein